MIYPLQIVFNNGIAKHNVYHIVASIDQDTSFSEEQLKELLSVDIFWNELKKLDITYLTSFFQLSARRLGIIGAKTVAGKLGWVHENAQEIMPIKSEPNNIQLQLDNAVKVHSLETISACLEMGAKLNLNIVASVFNARKHDLQSFRSRFFLATAKYSRTDAVAIAKLFAWVIDREEKLIPVTPLLKAPLIVALQNDDIETIDILICIGARFDIQMLQCAAQRKFWEYAAQRNLIGDLIFALSKTSGFDAVNIIYKKGGLSPAQLSEILNSICYKYTQNCHEHEHLQYVVSNCIKYFPDLLICPKDSAWRYVDSKVILEWLTKNEHPFTKLIFPHDIAMLDSPTFAEIYKKIGNKLFPIIRNHIPTPSSEYFIDMLVMSGSSYKVELEKMKFKNECELRILQKSKDQCTTMHVNQVPFDIHHCLELITSNPDVERFSGFFLSNDGRNTFNVDHKAFVLPGVALYDDNDLAVSTIVTFNQTSINVWYTKKFEAANLLPPPNQPMLRHQLGNIESLIVLSNGIIVTAHNDSAATVAFWEKNGQLLSRNIFPQGGAVSSVINRTPHLLRFYGRIRKCETIDSEYVLLITNKFIRLLNREYMVIVTNEFNDNAIEQIKEIKLLNDNRLVILDKSDKIFIYRWLSCFTKHKKPQQVASYPSANNQRKSILAIETYGDHQIAVTFAEERAIYFYDISGNEFKKLSIFPFEFIPKPNEYSTAIRVNVIKKLDDYVLLVGLTNGIIIILKRGTLSDNNWEEYASLDTNASHKHGAIHQFIVLKNGCWFAVNNSGNISSYSLLKDINVNGLRNIFSTGVVALDEDNSKNGNMLFIFNKPINRELLIEHQCMFEKALQTLFNETIKVNLMEDRKGNPSHWKIYGLTVQVDECIRSFFRKLSIPGREALLKLQIEEYDMRIKLIEQGCIDEASQLSDSLITKNQQTFFKPGEPQNKNPPRNLSTLPPDLQYLMTNNYYAIEIPKIETNLIRSYLDLQSVFLPKDIIRSSDLQNAPDIMGIGAGSGGKVFAKNWICKRTIANKDCQFKIVAFKVFDKFDFNEPEIVAQTIREIQIMLHLTGDYKEKLPKYTVPTYGVVIEPDRFGVVMEYYPLKSLDQLMVSFAKKNRELSWRERYCIVFDLAISLYILHNNGILHRDLKIENVLISEEQQDENTKCLRATLADFGNSIQINRKFRVMDRRLEVEIENDGGIIGTAQTMAPELALNTQKRIYNQKCDIYSFGVILLQLALSKAELFTDKMLLPNFRAEDIPKKIASGEYTLPTIGNICPPAFADIIKQCLNIHNPNSRPSALNIINLLRFYQSEIENHEPGLHEEIQHGLQ